MTNTGKPEFVQPEMYTRPGSTSTPASSSPGIPGPTGNHHRRMTLLWSISIGIVLVVGLLVYVL